MSAGSDAAKRSSVSSPSSAACASGLRNLQARLVVDQRGACAKNGCSGVIASFSKKARPSAEPSVAACGR
jgi:hypothetical protein